MRIIRHNAYISQRKTRAKLLALVGFLLLIGTLFLALLPNFLAPSYVAMLIGFVRAAMSPIGRRGHRMEAAGTAPASAKDDSMRQRVFPSESDLGGPAWSIRGARCRRQILLLMSRPAEETAGWSAH